MQRELDHHHHAVPGYMSFVEAHRYSRTAIANEVSERVSAITCEVSERVSDSHEGPLGNGELEHVTGDFDFMISIESLNMGEELAHLG